jgi:CheY-like chemotaxis protein
MGKLMRKLDIKIDKAENGQKAIDLVREATKRGCCRGYSLLLMDINMPLMNGYEVNLN